MVTVNYQSFGTSGFQLRLRLYLAGETRYINVTKLLKGEILKKHWDANAHAFTRQCPFSKENNGIITKFRQKYEDVAINWKGTVQGMIQYIREHEANGPDGPLVSEYIQTVIACLQRSRHKDGTMKGRFEDYYKLDKRLQKFCTAKRLKYNQLYLSELTPTLVNDFFDWITVSQEGKGMRNSSKSLHSIIMKADKDMLVNAEDFVRCNWHKGGNVASSQKFNSLTPEQVRMFKELNLREYSRSKRNELFRDFCLFILYTGQSPCDAIALKYSDIQRIGDVSHFVFKRRKLAHKQTVPCSVPISTEMQAIIDKWRKLSKDGYIFPIRSKATIQNQLTNNGNIKHFVGNLNLWLKPIGVALGCHFPLHTYTFRHTAITHYLSKGVPVIYVANMMGTSVENCEKIYYNNQADVASRNKVMTAMKF